MNKKWEEEKIGGFPVTPQGKYIKTIEAYINRTGKHADSSKRS